MSPAPSNLRLILWPAVARTMIPVDNRFPLLFVKLAVLATTLIPAVVVLPTPESTVSVPRLFNWKVPVTVVLPL